MISRIKNFIIIGLILATLVQVNALWFSGQSFPFPGIIRQEIDREITRETKQSFIKPFRIAFGHGAKEFSLYYNALNELEEKAMIDYIISQVISEGEFVNSGEVNQEELLSKKCVIYDYAVSLPFDSFAEAVGENNNAIASKIKQFDRITITPDNNYSSVSCYFSDKATNTFNKVSLDIDMNFFETLNSEKELKYILSQNEAVNNSFSEMIFIPDINPYLDYPTLEKINPYADALISTIEKNVDVFFENPSIKWRNGIDPYTFSDDTTVVKYYSNNVLEYSCYVATEEKAVSLLSAYSSAIEMIDRDTTVTNEYYLSELTYNDDGYFFGFDYVVDDFPVFLSKMKKKQTRMNHSIEINVLNGNVTKYKRYVMTFKSSESNTKITDLSYLEILNMMGGGNNGMTVSGLDLEYLIDDEQFLNLYWVLKGSSGADFTHPADL